MCTLGKVVAPNSIFQGNGFAGNSASVSMNQNHYHYVRVDTAQTHAFMVASLGESHPALISFYVLFGSPGT